MWDYCCLTDVSSLAKWVRSDWCPFTLLARHCGLRHWINTSDATSGRKWVKLQRWVKVKHAAAALLCGTDTDPSKLKEREGKRKGNDDKHFLRSTTGGRGALTEMNPLPWCAFKGVIHQAYCYCFNGVYWLAAHLHQGEVLDRFQAMLKWVFHSLLNSITALAPWDLSDTLS